MSSDKLQHSIYTKDAFGYYEKIFRKGESLPATRTFMFGVVYDGAKTSKIEIYEGNDDDKNPEYKLIHEHSIEIPDVYHSGKEIVFVETYNVDSSCNVTVKVDFESSTKH